MKILGKVEILVSFMTLFSSGKSCHCDGPKVNGKNELLARFQISKISRLFNYPFTTLLNLLQTDDFIPLILWSEQKKMKSVKLRARFLAMPASY